MKKLLILTITLFALTSLSQKAVAQEDCDSELYTTLGDFNNQGGDSLTNLKTFWVKMEGLPGTPFGITERYVLAKNRDYHIFLRNYQDLEGRVKLMLFNDEKEPVALEEIVSTNDGAARYSFRLPKTQLVYIAMYAPENVLGCAVMRLMF